MEKDFSGLLLVSDMDCTLLNSESRISEDNLAAIRYFISHGGKFAFATGRNHKNMKPFADAVRPNAPSILYNGSVLYDFSHDKSVQSINIDPSISDIITEIAENRPDIAIEIHKDGEIYEIHPNEFTKYHLSIVDFIPRYVCKPEDVPFPWVKVGFWTDSMKMEEFGELAESLNNGRFNFIRSHEFSCEFLSKDADKGIMLEEYRKLYRDVKIIACGDNENDAKMLKNADIGYAPANAFESAKLAADYVLDTDCDHSFIAAVIKKL